MSMITAHEWYREYFAQKAKQAIRDSELDAQEPLKNLKEIEGLKKK